MIKDHVRTSTYKQAIEKNKHLFKVNSFSNFQNSPSVDATNYIEINSEFQDKIVLDVGCGLGILSLFAAAAGAKTVIGIDASDIADYAEKVIRANGFKNIFVVKSKVEEIEKLPEDVTQVDIIVSEWMGFCLFHESMLGTVLYARDKWLKPDGLIFPDKAKLYLGCFNDAKKKEHKFNNWSSVYGYNMSSLYDVIYREAFSEILEPDQVRIDEFLNR